MMRSRKALLKRQRRNANWRAAGHRRKEARRRRQTRYASLANVLQRAYEQASQGKGARRHGQELPFDEQPMQAISSLLRSHHGLLFQALKKARESTGLPKESAVFELLGAINYLAGAIVYLEREPA